MERRKPEEDRIITIWVMKDVMSEPVQYRLSVNRMKRWAITAGTAVAMFVAVFVILIPLRMGVAVHRHDSLKEARRVEYENLRNDYDQLLEIKERYQVSTERLDDLSAKLSDLESETNLACERVEVVISGMEKELARWIPEGSMGGGDDDDEAGQVDLSPSQLSKVISLERRLSRMDERLTGLDTTVGDVHASWNERSRLFAALPSAWPVPGGRITSNFGMRLHPISGTFQMHKGVDICAERGTAIRATAPGAAIFAGRRSGYGNTLIIDHGYGITTLYGHCQKLLVGRGEEIKKGQKVALVGSTGRSTGPHLHFEVRVKGVPVDPLQYLSVFSAGAPAD